MTPKRIKTVNGKTVEEYCWNGNTVVYIGNHATSRTFDEIKEEAMSEKWTWDDNDEGEVYLYEQGKAPITPFSPPDVVSALNAQSTENEKLEEELRIEHLKTKDPEHLRPLFNKLAKYLLDNRLMFLDGGHGSALDQAIELLDTFKAQRDELMELGGEAVKDGGRPYSLKTLQSAIDKCKETT